LKVLIPSLVSTIVGKVEGCIVLVLALVVYGATQVLSVATLATLESTYIVVLIPSFTPPILIVPNLVLDIVLVGDGATKGSTTKFGKVWA
jgi:hypothetical protein